MAENTQLETKIQELLLKIPQTWQAYRPDDLSQVESQAVYHLTSAGLTERREGFRLQMLNSSIVGEAVITATGEYGVFESLEQFLAGMFLEWEESYKKWRSGKTSDVSPFHCQRTEPYEWRLTQAGVQELQLLQDGKLDWKTLLDFVLKRGFYDGKPRLVGGTVQRQLPVRGVGSLVSFRKVRESDENQAQTINIGNFGPNGEALSQVLVQIFGNMIDAKRAKDVKPSQEQNTKPESTKSGGKENIPEGEWSKPMSKERMMKALGINSLDTFNSFAERIGIEKINHKNHRIRLDKLDPKSREKVEKI